MTETKEFKVLSKKQDIFGTFEEIKANGHSNLLKRYWRNTKDVKKTVPKGGMIVIIHTEITNENACKLHEQLNPTLFTNLWHRTIIQKTKGGYIGGVLQETKIPKEDKLSYVMIIGDKPVNPTGLEIKNVLDLTCPEYIFTNDAVWQEKDKKYNIYTWKTLIKNEQKKDKAKQHSKDMVEVLKTIYT